MFHLWCISWGVKKSDWARLRDRGELDAVFEGVGNGYVFDPDNVESSPDPEVLTVSSRCETLFPPFVW